MSDARDEGSLFAARFSPSPSEVAELQRQRAAALRSKAEELAPGTPERAAAEAELRTDPSARGARGVLEREDLARARQTYGES